MVSIICYYILLIRIKIQILINVLVIGLLLDWKCPHHGLVVRKLSFCVVLIALRGAFGVKLTILGEISAISLIY